MEVAKENKLVPELRFKEFTHDWYSKKLSELFTFKNGINASKEDYGSGYKFINVLDIIENTFITHDRIKGEVNVSKDIFNKNIVEYGDVLFQRSSETRAEVGQANVYLDKNKPATFGGFVIRGKKIDNYDPNFMNYLLKTSTSRKEITTKSGGSTRFNVGQEVLSSVNIYSTVISEQQKIASFLSKVDEKITLLTKKKELLEEYKKGVTQKIFKQEIRFKIPNEAGVLVEPLKWEKRKLGDYLEHKSKRNKQLIVETILSVSNSKGFILQSDQFENHRIASKDVSNYKIVHKNDVAYNPSRINVGSIAILKDFDVGIISPMYVVFSLKNGLELSFFESLIETHLFKHLVKVGCSGSVRDSLNFEDLENFKLSLPKEVEEQQKIASFISSIDKKISAVVQQLSLAKEWKKGLLQKMFV